MIIKNFLWRIAAALTLAACAMLAHAATSPFPANTALSPPKQTTKMPDFEFANLNGGTLRSADMKGKVVVIRFWATR